MKKRKLMIMAVIATGLLLIPRRSSRRATHLKASSVNKSDKSDENKKS